MTRWIVALAMALVLAAGAAAQQKGKQFTLKGKVTEVSKDALTVNHGNVEGYMGAMTMPYKVDKVDILSKIKAGDEIEATVYADDYTLYNIKIATSPAPSQDKAKNKK